MPWPGSKPSSGCTPGAPISSSRFEGLYAKLQSRHHLPFLAGLQGLASLPPILKATGPQAFGPVPKKCSFSSGSAPTVLGWGPSRLMGKAFFPWAAFPNSSGGINRHLCSHCTCKHFKASQAACLLRLFYLSCFPTVALKCPDNGNYLIHLKFCPAHSRRTLDTRLLC